jgi:hypothetical protein
VKKYLLFALLIAVAALVINYALGGFKPIEPGLITTQEVTVYGRYYEGRYNSEALDELISELQTQLASSHEQGQLTIINYLQPELEKRGTVKQFVGIIWQDELANRSYDSLVLEPYNAAQFRIPVRPLVMPSPEKLMGLAEDLAEEMNTTLQGYSVEQYQDKTLIINFPLK